MYGDLILSAVLWAVFATVVAQVISLGVMWLLGLPPKKIRYEIEDVQNTAVGAFYLVISLISAHWVSLLSSDGVPQPAPALESALWIGGGLLVALIFTVIAFAAAHQALRPTPGENFYRWIQREVIDEQNAALALFLGGLAVAPFLAVLYQIF